MCPVALIALLDFTGLPGGRITQNQREVEFPLKQHEIDENWATFIEQNCVFHHQIFVSGDSF